MATSYIWGAAPHLIPYLQNDLLLWAHKSKLSLITSSAFHAEFEMIHPFSDGNGRMGRLWHSLLMAKQDNIYRILPLEDMILQNLDEYYHVLNISSRTGDSTRFIEYMLKITSKALDEFNRRMQRTI